MQFSAYWEYAEFVFDFRKNLLFADNTRNEIVRMQIIREMKFSIYG